jgi:SAM-dependent methyltransferase
MDFPQAVVHAGRGVQDAGLAGRISFLPGDFMNTPFPPGQDVLLMFNIIHGFSPETNRLLIQRAFDALQPGGRIYILDQFQSPSKGSPVSRFIPLMVGLNLLNEIGGNVYSMEEIRAWCGARTLVRNHRVGLPGVGLAEIALQ